MATPHTFVGIDVAKAHLDVAVRPSGERWTVANDDDGIPTLVTQLQPRAPTLIVLEATGGRSTGGRRRPGGRRPACGGGQSAPDARLCQSDRAVGQD
jgi:hypothetical protein